MLYSTVMPSTVPVLSRIPTLTDRARYATESPSDGCAHVHPTPQDEQALAELHRTLSKSSPSDESQYAEPHLSLDKYYKENRARSESGKPLGRLGVCFKNLTTWGEQNEHAKKKTFADAVWRTLTFQDVYEWTIKRWIDPPRIQNGRPLIHDFSGVVRSGEIMLYVNSFSLSNEEWLLIADISSQSARPTWGWMFDILTNVGKPSFLFSRCHWLH